MADSHCYTAKPIQLCKAIILQLKTKTPLYYQLYCSTFQNDSLVSKRQQRIPDALVQGQFKA